MLVPTADAVVRTGSVRASAIMDATRVNIQDTNPTAGSRVGVQVCAENVGITGGSDSIDVRVNGSNVGSVTLSADPTFSDCGSVTVTVPDADTMRATAGGVSDTVDVAPAPEPDPNITTTSVDILDPSPVAGERVQIEVCATNFGGSGSESFGVNVNGGRVTSIVVNVAADTRRCFTPSVSVPVPDAAEMTVGVGGTSATVPVEQPTLDPSQTTAQCTGVRSPQGRVVDGRLRVTSRDAELTPTASVTNAGDVAAVTNVAFHWGGVLLGGAFDVRVAPGETETDVTPADAPFVVGEIEGLSLPITDGVVAEAQNPTSASSPVAATDGGVRAGAGGCGCGCGGGC